MSHYDDDTLALLALGESDAAADGGAHLGECAACQADVVSLAQVVSIGRTTSAADVPETPSPHVWTRIQDEVHADNSPTSEPRPSGVVSLDSRRRGRRAGWLIAIAASLIGLMVGVGITVIDRHTAQSKSVTVATAALGGLSVATAHGRAVIAGDTKGQRTLTVNIKDLPVAKNGFYEVWLMNAKPARFLAVGALDIEHHGVFQLPPGLDLTSYPYIDVSLQPFNGSPLHSGDSVVRGPLHA